MIRIISFRLAILKGLMLGTTLSFLGDRLMVWGLMLMSMSLGMLGLAAACLVEERDSVGVGGVDWFSSLGSEPTPN